MYKYHVEKVACENFDVTFQRKVNNPTTAILKPLKFNLKKKNTAYSKSIEKPQIHSYFRHKVKKNYINSFRR